MNRSFKFWMLGQGISQFGDWLYIVGVYWIIIQNLQLKSWHGNLQGLLGATVALTVGFLKLRLPSHWSPRGVMVGHSVYLALKSSLVAYLTYTGNLTFEVLLLFTIIGGALGILTAPSSTFFHLSLTGDKQHQATSFTDLLFWITRFSVGLTVALAAFQGAWSLFAVDAVSYLPLLLILMLVRLQYRDREAEQKAAEHSLWDGVRFARRDLKTKYLLLLNTVSMSFCAVVFSLAAEVVKTNLGGGVQAYGTMLAITGVAGLLGSLLSVIVAYRSPSVKTWVFLISTLLVPLAVLAVGASSSLLGFWITYGTFCLLSSRSTLTEAELKLAPKEHQGGLSRLKEILSRGLTPLMWFLISFLGDWYGLNAKQIVSYSATVGFVLTLVIILKMATKPGLLSSLFAPRVAE